MTRKLQAYTRRKQDVACQQILGFTQASLQKLERRTSARIHASSLYYDAQLEQLKDQLEDTRKEICQLIKKEGAKQQIHLEHIFEDVREPNSKIYESSSEGSFQGTFDKVHKKYQVFKQDNIYRRQKVAAYSENENFPDLGLVSRVLVNTSASLPHLQEIGCSSPVPERVKVVKSPPTVPAIDNKEKSPEKPGLSETHMLVKTLAYLSNVQEIGGSSQVFQGVGLADRAPAVLAFDNEDKSPQKPNLGGDVTKAPGGFAVYYEDKSPNTPGLSETILADPLMEDIGSPVDSDSKLNGMQGQEMILSYAKGPTEPQQGNRLSCTLEKGIKPSELQILYHPQPISVNPHDHDLKDFAWKAFSFTENHAEPHGTAQTADTCDKEGHHYHKPAFEVSKRKIGRLPVRSQESCTSISVHSKPTKIEPCLLPMKQGTSSRQPTRHFTGSDIELLVMGVEKFGTGRWRDIKEVYFSLQNHRSAANLKVDIDAKAQNARFLGN